MLMSLVIDNYRCFSGFRCDFESLHLLLGSNGTGKSSIFHVLHGIQQLIGGRPVSEIFRGAGLTKWRQDNKQDFQLRLRINEVNYSYRLIIEHDENHSQCHITSEILNCEGKFLLRTEIISMLNQHFKTGKIINVYFTEFIVQ